MLFKELKELYILPAFESFWVFSLSSHDDVKVIKTDKNLRTGGEQKPWCG